MFGSCSNSVLGNSSIYITFGKKANISNVLNKNSMFSGDEYSHYYFKLCENTKDYFSDINCDVDLNYEYYDCE
jgi:hypothetical protein